MDAISLVRLALQVLTERVISLSGLVMACFLAGWVMYVPSWERVVGLGIFCLMAYLVIRMKESKREDQQAG